MSAQGHPGSGMNSDDRSVSASPAVMIGMPVRLWTLRSAPIHLTHHPDAQRPYAGLLRELPEWVLEDDVFAPRG